jgi:translocation and assembly module TamB
MTTPATRLPWARRLLGGALLIAGVIAVVLATSPWWWAAGSRSALARQGITFGRHETLGYARFALHEVRFENATTSLTVARLEADAPLVWAIRGLFSRPGPVMLDEWTLRLKTTDTTDASPPAAIDGWPALRTALTRTASTLERWLPAARATRGSLSVGKNSLGVGVIDWSAGEGRISADGLVWKNQSARADLRWLAAEERLVLTATEIETTRPTVLRLETRADTLTGELILWEQPVRIDARFPARGWLPAQARLDASQLALPGRVTRLGEFYPELVTDLRLLWENARFTLRLSARGQPDPSRATPPLLVELAAEGDAQQVQIARADLSLPGTTARLLAPIVFARDGEILSGPSQFSLESDLEKLPGAAGLSGKITGRVRVLPAGDDPPLLTAELEARDVQAGGFAVKNSTFEAEQVGALLTVKKSSITFADGSTASIAGAWDWTSRTLTDGALEGEIKAGALARVLPASWSFARFSVSARAAGRWPGLSHSGQIGITDLAAGSPQPVTLAADWRGLGPVAESFQLKAQTGATTLAVAGGLSRERARIETISLALPDGPELRLAQPATITWRPALRIEQLELTGADTAVRARLSDSAARVELTALDSSWLRDVLPAESLPWRLQRLIVDGAWPGGVLTGSGEIAGEIQITPDKTARIDAEIKTGAEGVWVERLRVDDAAGPVLSARGRVPYAILPTARPAWKLLGKSAWSLRVESAPDSPFWTAQAEATGVSLTAPRIVASIEGPAQKPDAFIDVQAREIVFQRARLPPLSGLDARLVLEANRIALERFTLTSAGQTLTASGQSSVDPQRWTEIFKNHRLLWQGDACVRVQAPALELSAFATFLPDALAPTGVLDGDIAVKADGSIRGTLRITDASTHPISPVGAFNQISSEIVFDGRQATLRWLTALVGGQRVEAQGTIGFPADAPLMLDLTLAGKNLPLARQTGLLLRGDLDVRVKSSDDGVTTLSGDVKLYDGLFLRDVRALIPRRGGGAASRPPYFSVTQPPFRDWRLALQVGGERFIQLRTPLFNGVLSGRFQLGGTLFEPLAIGEAVFEQGVVLLPFANLRLRNGSVRLTQADPYTPQLALNAESRTLGYDVRMDLSGPASEPVLVFSSSPPLSSEQVLLMVMAGQTPRSDITYSGGQRAVSIGRYLGKSLLSGLFGSPGDAERLTLSSGENVSENGQETFRAEYQLNDRWSLVGERDEFDDYNVGFKRRLFTTDKKDADAPAR